MANALGVGGYTWQHILKDPLKEIPPVDRKPFYKKLAASVNLEKTMSLCSKLQVSFGEKKNINLKVYFIGNL